MSSKFTKTKGAKFYISKEEAFKVQNNLIGMIHMTCTVKDISFSSPAGDEIDVTTLCSEAKETISGQKGEPTVSFNVNFKACDYSQELLRNSQDTDAYHAFLLVMEDDSRVGFLARCSNYDFATGNGVMTGSFNLKLKGSFQFFYQETCVDDGGEEQEDIEDETDDPELEGDGECDGGCEIIDDSELPPDLELDDNGIPIPDVEPKPTEPETEEK